MYVYCVVCYCVIVAPYVRSVGHVFAYLYTLNDDSESPIWTIRLLYTLKFFPVFVCDLGDIDCIFGLDAGKEAGFITPARTGRIWFNANEHGEPEKLSRNSSNAICHLRAVQRIELKPFKATTIEVTYAKNGMGHRFTLAYGQILV